MNPYEQPTYIRVTKCPEYWGTSEFEVWLLEELNEHENELPLEDLCTGGGLPSDHGCEAITDLKYSESNGIVTGSFTVHFTEERTQGCRNNPWKTRVSGQVSFSLNLATGDLELEPPTNSRQYEPEEF